MDAQYENHGSLGHTLLAFCRVRRRFNTSYRTQRHRSRLFFLLFDFTIAPKLNGVNQSTELWILRNMNFQMSKPTPWSYIEELVYVMPTFKVLAGVYFEDWEELSGVFSAWLTVGISLTMLLKSLLTESS